MRTKHMGKFLSGALAAMLIAGMSVPAMAATLSDGSGTQALGTVESSDTTLTIPKGIVLFNETEGSYFSPTISYTYAIAPASVPDSSTVTDESGNTARVHNGITGGLSITTQPEFTTGTQTMDADGEEITSNIVLAVDLTKFTSPGVYRYELTDNTAASVLYAAGLERESDYQANRFVDVYIVRNAAGNMEVGGYVLLKENTSATTTSSKKSQGFIEADDTDTAPTGFDTYTTYNVTLKKDVEGTMGDRNHEFPFSVTITNNDYQYLWAEGTASTVPSTFAASGTTALTSASLKHDDEIYIRGLNAHATIAYTETIDVDDVYKVKVTGDSGSVLVAEASKEENDTTALSALHVTDYESVNSATDVTADAAHANNVKDVTFVNTMDQVSPTGLALRYAPYLLMIGFAAAAGMIFGRRKKTDRI